jgi:HSP20 family molecular chaperone IbpA|tara:strand:+ start:1055 stop:1381 length:327 start_codon:yes stop_codon:yes gene_type:complete
MTNYINDRINENFPEEYSHALFRYEIDPPARVVRLNVAGIKKNEIEIQVEGNSLRVKAESEDNKSLRYIHNVRIPSNVDVDSIKAKYSDGLLTIDMESDKKKKMIDVN